MTVVLTCVTLAAIFDDPAKTLSDLGKGVAESASSAFQGATDVLHQTGVLQTHPPLPPVVHPPPSPHPPPKSPSPLHPPPLQPPPSSPVDRCFVARGWGAHGEGFRGSVSYTRTGRECQPWSRQYPHTHTLPAKLGTNTTLVSNYCRNPVGMGVPLQAGPWCFTTDPEVRLEVCAICDAPDALLVPVKPPNVHRPVPEWVGPFCLSFAVLVLLALVAVVLLRYSSFEWPSLNEMAFGRAVETRSMLGAPRRQTPRNVSELTRTSHGGGGGGARAAAQVATFSTLARLAQSNKGSSGEGTPRATAGLSLLDHDSIGQQPLHVSPPTQPLQPLQPAPPATPAESQWL